MTETEPNPFADIEDEAARDPKEARADLLDAAKREYFPLRKEFVQRPKGVTDLRGRPVPRASKLYDLVNSRNQLALDFYLLLHALQPILEGTPLPLATWAHIMSVKRPVTATAVTRAISTLQKLDLVVREDDSRSPVIRLLDEDGSGDDYVKPGTTEEAGPGYFTVPHAYWNTGLSEELTMPGKAMFLIALAETHSPGKLAFSVAVERVPKWYGISERTAERGYRELIVKTKVMRFRVKKIADKRHPAKRREEYWRALDAPYSNASRASMQKRAMDAAKKANAGSTTNLVALNVDIPDVPHETAESPETPTAAEA
jgi:hypothetical protein